MSFGSGAALALAVWYPEKEDPGEAPSVPRTAGPRAPTMLLDDAL